jgi:hypothetical protein
MALLFFVKKDICLAINKSLGIENPAGDAPADSGCAPGGSLWTGTPAAAPFFHIGDGDKTLGKSAACVIWSCHPSHPYLYYHVLLER